MRRLLFLLSGALLAGTAGAADLSPADFAYGLPLEPAREAPLYRLELPEPVYLGAAHPELRDLRVFNAAGEAVPFALRAAPAAVVSEIEPVAVFPIPGPVDADEPSVRVRTDDRGAVIDVTPGQPLHTARPIGGYLLDLSQLRRPVHRLQLTWAEPEQGAVGQVKLAVSDDLHGWRTVGTATLAELRMDGHRLRRDTIDLPGVNGRYLRLEWPAELRALHLQSAQAELRDRAPPPLRWRTVDGRADAEGGLLFDSGGHLPVTQVQLLFADANRLLEARLDSGPSADGPWRTRAGGVFYRLRNDGEELVNPPLTTAAASDRYWRLRPTRPAAPPDGLRLRLGWQPRELVFLAQGTGPFLLAYGSARAATAEAAPGLPRNLGDDPHLVAEVRIGEQRTLAGPSAALPPPPPLPWRRWALWATLIAAAAALCVMAWRLARDMRDESDR